MTYNGRPLEKGEIHFFPEDAKGGVRASGAIENGAYALGTVGDKNGARPGKYKVGIIAKEDSEAQARAAFEKARAAASRGTRNVQEGMIRIPPEFRSQAMREAKSLIPAGYGDVRTTDLSAEVKEGPNEFDFTLSDKNAPPDPPKATGKSRSRR